MPWGDYGNTLFEGRLLVMDENYQITEVHKIERTAPYIPEIYTTISNYIVVLKTIKWKVRVLHTKKPFNSL